MKYYIDGIIDGNTLTLDEYLEIVLYKDYKKVYPNNCFPSNELLNEYISRIKEFDDRKVKQLLYRYLVQEGSYGLDELHKKFLIKDKTALKNIDENTPLYLRRLLFTKHKTWEGITWIVDLLPSYPKDAINVIDCFFKIYCMTLPDDVMFGLSNCTEIIRAKYLEFKYPIDVLLNLSPYEFESLIAELFSEIGYRVNLTKRTHDDGIDILAINQNITKVEKIVIQCKRYKQNITVSDIRELIGVVEITKATKGIFCTSSNFTNSAIKLQKETNRIELINGQEIIKLCNEYLGVNWPVKISTYLYKNKEIIYSNKI
jgi:restriction system protein